MTNISPSLYPARLHGNDIADALCAAAPDYMPKRDFAPVFVNLANRNAKSALWAQLEAAVLALCCIGVGVIFGVIVTLYAFGQ